MKLIPLTQGKVTKVSDHRYDFLNQWKWYYHKGYAVRNTPTHEGKQIQIHMHRVINQTPDGMETDHRNTNKLNNQDKNLRVATNSQNQMNKESQKNSSSKYKGVRWHIKAKKWEAQIRVNKKLKYLGLFNDEIEAAKAYNQAAMKYFGEYANLNLSSQGVKK